MVRNISHRRLIDHLDTLPSHPHCELMNEIIDREMDLYRMYEFLKRFDDHVLMMAISYPYLRLAIERGADLRQRNSGDNPVYDISLGYEDKTKRNWELILKWLREHPR